MSPSLGSRSFSDNVGNCPKKEITTMAIRTLKRRFDPWADDMPRHATQPEIDDVAEGGRAAYERARADALASGEDADICLRDLSGHVVANFWQQTTQDADGQDYQTALNPPYDASMERFNNMPTSAESWRRRRHGRRRQRR